MTKHTPLDVRPVSLEGVTYERYLIDRHIPDLLETGAFEGATISRSAPGRYRILYEARSREALNRYLAEHLNGYGAILQRPSSSASR